MTYCHQMKKLFPLSLSYFCCRIYVIKMVVELPKAKNIPFLRLQKYFFLLHYQVGIEQKLWGSWLVGGKKILPYLLQLLSYDALSSGASKRQALSKIALKYNIVTTTTGICVYFCSWTKKELKWEIPVIFSAIFRWCSFLAMANHKKILRQEGVKTKD